MDTCTSPHLLFRFSQIIEAVCRAIGYHSVPRYTPWGNTPPVPAWIADRAWTRLVRARAAIVALMARFQAGTLRPATVRAKSATPRRRSAATEKPLPRRLGWLCNHVLGEAAIRGNHLRLLLAEPEMQALLAATPRAAKILKPVCRMLGIEATALVGRISEAQSAVATLPHAKPSYSAAPSTPTPHASPADPPGIRRDVPS